MTILKNKMINFIKHIYLEIRLFFLIRKTNIISFEIANRMGQELFIAWFGKRTRLIFKLKDSKINESLLRIEDKTFLSHGNLSEFITKKIAIKINTWRLTQTTILN